MQDHPKLGKAQKHLDAIQRISTQRKKLKEKINALENNPSPNVIILISIS